MSNTFRMDRFGGVLAKIESTSEEEMKANRELYWKALRGECTNADIAELEAGDLTDVSVVGTLRAAYEAQDPTDRSRILWCGKPSTAASDAELDARIREAEGKLGKNPTDYETRVIRLEALCELARRGKQEAVLREAGKHRATTRERQGLGRVDDCPGWEALLNALSEAAELHEPGGEPWQVTVLGERDGRLQIESRGGDAVTRGLELLAHVASGYTCQQCGASAGEHHVGV